MPGAARAGCGGRSLAQRLGELLPSGVGPACGLSRLIRVLLDLAGLPVPVGLPVPRRLLLAAGVLAKLLKPFGVAHRRVGLERFLARFQLRLLFL